MARGWESKSVEAQQEEATAKSTSKKPRLTRKDIDRLREKENLLLSLKSIRQQLDRSQNTHYRAQLERALADLEGKIRDLDAGGSITRPSGNS